MPAMSQPTATAAIARSWKTHRSYRWSHAASMQRALDCLLDIRRASLRAADVIALAQGEESMEASDAVRQHLVDLAKLAPIILDALQELERLGAPPYVMALALGLSGEEYVRRIYRSRTAISACFADCSAADALYSSLDLTRVSASDAMRFHPLAYILHLYREGCGEP